MSQPHQDHCHRTERERDWLCQSCNVGLGMAQDDHRECLAKARAYQLLADRARSDARRLRLLRHVERCLASCVYLLRHGE